MLRMLCKNAVHVSKTENRMESTLCFVGLVLNTPSRFRSSHENTNSNSIISCCCCCFVLVLVVVVLELAVVCECSGIVRSVVRICRRMMVVVFGVLVLIGRVAGRSYGRFGWSLAYVVGMCSCLGRLWLSCCRSGCL